MTQKIIMGILIALIVGLLGVLLFPVKTEAEPVLPHVPDKLDVWLDKLAQCESQNREWVVNPDDGGSPSIGLLQFKLDTFRTQARKYDLFTWTEDAEFENLIQSGDAQRQVAKVMLQANPENWRHWYNCGVKIGEPSK